MSAAVTAAAAGLFAFAGALDWDHTLPGERARSAASRKTIPETDFFMRTPLTDGMNERREAAPSIRRDCRIPWASFLEREASL
jgi:hypothetical protein